MGFVLWFTDVFKKGGIYMKPIIGITASENGKGTSLKDTYVKRVLEAGGVPIILPSLLTDQIEQLLKRIDGLLLSGGGDIDPNYFGEDPHPYLGEVAPRRDGFEIALAKQALHMNTPILGICRGMQVLNVAAGGNMYQDLSKQRKEESIQHSQKAPTHHASHTVHLKGESLLKKLIGAEEVRVNSFHHQAVKNVPEPFIISARSNDDVIEAIESLTNNFVVGVQWHPEELMDVHSTKLFEKFIEESRERK